MKNKFKIELIFTLIILVLVIAVALIILKYTNNRVEGSKASNEVISSSDKISVTLNESYEITSGGVYDLTGIIENGQITIDTSDEVKLILNNVSITNNSGPCILVLNAKSVIIELADGTTNTLTDGENYSVSDTDINACIYSKDDLTITGTGNLIINANYLDGIVSKDDLVISSGTITVNSKDDAIKGKDSVTIESGNITISSGGDAIKSTNDTDEGKGNIVINGGKINITSVKDGFDAANTLTLNDGDITIKSSDDGMHADGYLEINGGSINIDAVEGLEATYVKINDGTINISASDDGINASNKSSKYDVTIEINGGNITIKMNQGDTDGIDSNGNLYINGGTLNITGQSPFDYDGEAKYTGGTMIVNGEEVTTITNQFAGGMGGPNPGMGPR